VDTNRFKKVPFLPLTLIPEGGDFFNYSESNDVS